jgi:hypothetical protein
MQLALKNGRMRIVFVAILACAAMGAWERTEAIEALDQSQELLDAGFSLASVSSIQQTFKPSYENVTAISVWVNGPGTVTIQVLDALCGTLLGSGTTTTNGVSAWVKVILGTPISVVPEADYAFRVSGTPASSSYWAKQNNPYPRGALHLNCSTLAGGYDATFRTYSDDALLPTVPIVWGELKRLYR